MRVLMNGVPTLKPKTGIGHTTAQLHRALVAGRPGDTFWLYPGTTQGGAASRLWRGLTPRGGGFKVGMIRQSTWRNTARACLRELAKGAYRSHFQTTARWGDFDLYHETNLVPIPTPLPTVVMVHDLSVLLYPQWHPDERVRFYDSYFRPGIRAAARILVATESVRREVVTVLGVDPGRVDVVLHGMDAAYRPQPPETVAAVRQRFGLPDRYFLCVGTIEPRKNLLTAMTAYADLPADVRAGCPLVLAGGWGWKAEAERAFYERVGRDRGVILPGYIPDADLPGLYAGATALLYPSHYEGFGLPPLEMLACGGAVIASTATAVREVLGRHARFVDPLDVGGWRDAMHRAATDPGFLAGPSAGGVAHAATFTWEKAAAETFRIYQSALGRGVEGPPATVEAASLTRRAA